MIETYGGINSNSDVNWQHYLNTDISDFRIINSKDIIIHNSIWIKWNKKQKKKMDEINAILETWKNNEKETDE